jgi:hypothetical protein
MLSSSCETSCPAMSVPGARGSGIRTSLAPWGHDVMVDLPRELDGELPGDSQLARRTDSIGRTNRRNRKPANEAVKSCRWRREWDSNPRYGFPHTRFPSVRLKPLGHLSGAPSLEGAPMILQGIAGRIGRFSATCCIYGIISVAAGALTRLPAEPQAGLARRFTGSRQTRRGTP